MLSYQFPNKSDLFVTDILIIHIYIWNITTFLSFNNLRQTKYYDYTLARPSQFLQLKCHANYLVRFNFTLFNLSLHNITGSWRGTPCLRKVWGAWSRWPLKEEKETLNIFLFPELSKCHSLDRKETYKEHFQIMISKRQSFSKFCTIYAVHLDYWQNNYMIMKQKIKFFVINFYFLLVLTHIFEHSNELLFAGKNHSSPSLLLTSWNFNLLHYHQHLGIHGIINCFEKYLTIYMAIKHKETLESRGKVSLLNSGSK